MSRLSARSAFAVHPDAFAHKISAARARGGLLDLAESNPTRVGLAAPELISLLGHPRGASYEPAPCGERRAREVAARELSRGGVTVDPSRTVLTASTSESYGWLFRLLCDPGDEVLVPVPSYPLFEVLAQLEGVRARPYALEKDERFALCASAIEAQLSPLTRAVVVVHPNNPTGTMASAQEAAELRAALRARGVALIADEVFADWILEGAGRLPSFALGDDGPLTFVLSGLSKALLLPQVKLGWLSVQGDGHPRALERLEWIADAYLSSSGPAQLALPELLARKFEVQAPLHARLRANLAALDRAAAFAGGVGLRRLPVHGGWSAVLEVPRTQTEEEWCAALLDVGVVVSPGFFFDFPTDGHLVVSLLPDEATFEEGATRLARVIARASDSGLGASPSEGSRPP